LTEALCLVLGQHFEVSRLTPAPSSSWLQQRDPQSSSRLYGPAKPWDDAEDGIYGARVAAVTSLTRTNRSWWDAFLNFEEAQGGLVVGRTLHPPPCGSAAPAALPPQRRGHSLVSGR